MVLRMEQGQSEQDKLIKQIEEHVTAISTWASMFEAVDQETVVEIMLPSPVVGEVGRSIQRSVLAVRELVNDLDVS